MKLGDKVLGKAICVYRSNYGDTFQFKFKITEPFSWSETEVSIVLKKAEYEISQEASVLFKLSAESLEHYILDILNIDDHPLSGSFGNTLIIEKQKKE